MERRRKKKERKEDGIFIPSKQYKIIFF